MPRKAMIVIAVSLTGQPPGAGFPPTLESGAPGIPKGSWILIRQIRTLAVERIGRRIVRASDVGLDRVVEGRNEIIAGP